ncbi:anhydro-N-acetylmuramic acid kinase [Alicyclobacillus acidiphilus]|nr:anhydro-N-acetylmuramic acid kinase [Alicyclobacillus acidiphilus]
MERERGLAIGMMSGTSGDGIDAALVQFSEEGEQFPVMKLVSSHYVPYTESQRKKLFRLFDPNVSARFVARMDIELGDWLGEAALQLMRQADVGPAEIAVIGSHGQTVYHAPNLGVSLQIGDGARIARATGCAVVTDFRRQDIALGGQGAPLIPYFDYAYLRDDAMCRVALNIGGIANVTILPAAGDFHRVAAFDTGPGNMLIDGLVRELTGGEQWFDEDGQLAKRGNPVRHLVEAWLRADPYVSMPPPKSTGRERYGRDYLARLMTDMRGLSVVDQVATVTQFVAESISVNIAKCVTEPFELIAGGGGRRNGTLMEWIRVSCQPVRLIDSTDLGIPSDMKEAMAFALFAWQFLHDRPTNVPSATGATQSTQLGKLTPPM